MEQIITTRPNGTRLTWTRDKYGNLRLANIEMPKMSPFVERAKAGLLPAKALA